MIMTLVICFDVYPILVHNTGFKDDEGDKDNAHLS